MFENEHWQQLSTSFKYWFHLNYVKRQTLKFLLELIGIMTSGDLMRRLMGQAISLNTHHSSVLFIVDKCNLKHPIRCSSHTTICKTVTAQWSLSVGSVGDLAAVCFLSKNSASGSKTASRQEEEEGGGIRGHRGPPAQWPETRPGSHSWTGSTGHSHWSAPADPSMETWGGTGGVRAEYTPIS